MPASTRRSRLPDVAPAAVEHAGLWLDRYLPALPLATDRVERSPQAEHIAAVEQMGEPKGYRATFDRWVGALTAAGVVVREGAVEGRVVVGLGGESVLETAITIHRAYGVPYIPGSALKGTAAAYARRFLGGEWAAGGAAYETVFGAGGDRGNAGYVTFFDALYIPGSSPSGRPLAPDVLTVHHQEYYNKGGARPPADWDSPNPVSFVSATGAYLLALAGPSEAWVERSFELLGAALAEIGVGAKTSSGYGRLSVRPFVGASTPPRREARPPATPNAPQPSAPSAPQPTAHNAPPERPVRRLPEVGESIRGEVIKGDEDMFVIKVPGFEEREAVAVLKREPGVPNYRIGKDSVRVEVVRVRQTKSGLTVLDVRRPQA